MLLGPFIDLIIETVDSFTTWDSNIKGAYLPGVKLIALSLMLG